MTYKRYNKHRDNFSICRISLSVSIQFKRRKNHWIHIKNVNPVIYKFGIMNYQYTRPQISYFQTENQCQMHPAARSAEIDDVFYL